MLEIVIQGANPEFALSLGSSSSFALVRGMGVVRKEPSVVALYDGGSNAGMVAGVGEQARTIKEKSTDKIRFSFPINGGSIRNFKHTKLLLQQLVEALPRAHYVRKPAAMLAVSFNTSDVERFALREAAALCGFEELYLFYEPLLAAIGTGLPVLEPHASMVVDIGAGATSASILCLGGVVAQATVPIGGNAFDAKIIEYVRIRKRVLITHASAEELRRTLGFVRGAEGVASHTVPAREISTGSTTTATLTERDLREALQVHLDEISSLIRGVFEEVSPEIASDVCDAGVVLVGGGALIKDIECELEERTGLPVMSCEDPDTAVISGAAHVLEHWNEYLPCAVAVDD